MRRQRAVKLTLKKSFKSSLILAGLIILSSPLMADELDKALSMEREGRQLEARKFYLSWLGNASSPKDERFGRILLHLIRMPGSAEEDMDLIERYLAYVPSGEDRTALLEYAMVLSELRGEDSLRYREQLSGGLRSESGLSGRLPPDEDDVLSDPCIGPGVSRKDEYLLFLAYNSWEGDSLLTWLGRAHILNPGLLDSPDWLFQLVRVLKRNGLKSEAEEYRVRLMTRFSDSLEADLLTGRVSLLPGPSDLLSDATLSPDNDEQASAAAVTENPPVYIQVGAFSRLVNAQILRDQIQKEGLESIISEENGAFKLIILSRDDFLTADVMKRLDLKGFRIPRIP